MQTKFIIASGIIAAAAFFVQPASAESCKRSCTEVANQCVAMGGRGCDADLASCKKNGNLHMPSGRTFKNLCKK
jgi:hypothetical protein